MTLCQVHLFPEGKVNQGKEMLRFKWGISQLLMNSKRLPLVIPIVLDGTLFLDLRETKGRGVGMAEIMPLDAGIIPRLGKDLHFWFGNEVQGLDDLVASWRKGDKNNYQVRTELAGRIREAVITEQQKLRIIK